MSAPPTTGSSVSTAAAPKPAVCSHRGSTSHLCCSAVSIRHRATAPATAAMTSMANTTPSAGAIEREYGGQGGPPGTGGTALLTPSSATAAMPTTESSQHASMITTGGLLVER